MLIVIIRKLIRCRSRINNKDACKGVRRVKLGVNNDDDAGIVYFIHHMTRPVMVNDLVRMSRTVPYECTVYDTVLVRCQ